MHRMQLRRFAARALAAALPLWLAGCATAPPGPEAAAVIALAPGGKLDAFASNKTILHGMSDGVPGSRVLEGRYGLEAFAIGIPKGREAGLRGISEAS